MIDPEPTDQPRIDPSRIRDLFDGDRSFLDEFVSLFADESGRLRREIEAAFAIDDPRKVQASAHSLKGMLSHLGPSRALDLAEQLEIHGVPADKPNADQILAELFGELNRIRDELERL